MNSEIIGVWEIDPNDMKSINLYGKMVLEFKKNGDLIYNTYNKGKIQKMLLTYEIKDNLVITDQPSSPRKEETEYQILSDTKLRLYFNGIESTFNRIP